MISERSMRQARDVCDKCGISQAHAGQMAEALDAAFAEGLMAARDFEMFDMLREHVRTDMSGAGSADSAKKGLHIQGDS